MKCKWTDCENEARAKSPFCSGTCKKRYQRASGTNVPVGASGTESPPQDAPQSTNGGEVVVERTRKVAIPGDADYVGCCKQVDGEWQVDSTTPNIKGMSDDELVRRLHFITDWKQSPEHKEILRRRVA